MDVDNSGSATIVTNYHVIEGESFVSVQVSGGTRTAEVVGYDAIKDLAVLRICCDAGFQAVPWSDQVEMKPGSAVFTMGYPVDSQVGGKAKVTRGVVSDTWFDGERWLVQTDAPLNPGNSGGPLFTVDGEVVGINTSGLRETLSGIPVEGVGFAIATRTIQELLPAMMAGLTVDVPIVPIAVFPAYQTIAAIMSSYAPALSWRLDNSTAGRLFYYGFFDRGYFGIPPADLVTLVFAYLDSNTPEDLHTAAILLMLVAVGYDEERALDVGGRHVQQYRPAGGACVTQEQVLITTYPPLVGRQNWVTEIVSQSNPNWWAAPPC